MEDTTGTDLLRRETIAELVATYCKAEMEIRAGFDLINGGLESLGRTFSPDRSSLRYHTLHRDSFHFWTESPDTVIRELRRKCWRALIERMQIRKVMSVKAWKDLDDKLDKGDPPDITQEIVDGMVSQVRDDLPAMAEDAVKEVFEILRPHHDRFKTNTQFEIGRKVVLEYALDPWGKFYARHWHVNHRRMQDLLALENVFLMLDGRIRRDEDGYWSQLQTAIHACSPDGPCEGETEYFRFRGFKRGTLHIEFRRPELVKKLNAIAGGARLKPAAKEK